jgi:hypothetical protein
MFCNVKRPNSGRLAMRHFSKFRLSQLLCSVTFVAFILAISAPIVSAGQIVRNADGSSVETRDDGTKIIKNADGSSIETRTDASKLITNSDGSSIETRADGTKIVKNFDGSSIRTNPDGTQLVTNADGTTELIKPKKKRRH